MKTVLAFLKNPFYRVAGYTSLVWGVAGIVVATAIAFVGGVHFHGLLHYGGAPNGAWWCFVVEHLAVWLVPSVLIYLLALFCSRSHVRPVDVLGTVAFAQLPFARDRENTVVAGGRPAALRHDLAAGSCVARCREPVAYDMGIVLDV